MATMTNIDFQKLEAFEEQVYQARELFLASVHNPARPDMLRILAAAEKTLETAREALGLDLGRREPQPWWRDWQAERSRGSTSRGAASQ